MKPIHSIIEFHQLLSLPEPQHPLVSVVRVEELSLSHRLLEHFYLDFYTISLKKGVEARVKYGQQYYDYNKGLMNFTAPKQVQIVEDNSEEGTNSIGTGYVLFIHPDFLHGHQIANNIRDYGFFSYATNEALHLAGHEEESIIQVFEKIKHEYQFIDKHTQNIIIAQIELLLSYCMRFYERQFITRKAVNIDLLTKMEQLLENYFTEAKPLKTGLPTVEYIAGELHLSSHYLSDFLRSLTGLTAQQKIHDFLIDKAKLQLSTSNLSISEIAFSLGFEYP